MNMDTEPIAREEDLRLILKSLIKSNQYAESDPETALTYARKSAEAMCRCIYTSRVGEPSKIMLNELVQQLSKKKIIPSKMEQPLITIQKYGNFASHPDIDIESIDTEYIAPCVIALKQFTKWFFQEYLKTEVPSSITEIWPGTTGHSISIIASTERHVNSQPPTGIGIASPEDLLAWWNWEVKDIINQTMAIDYYTVLNLDDHTEGQSDQWLSIVTNQPDTVRLLVDGSKRKIIGYWHFVPLFENEYRLAKQGKLYDEQITPDKVCFLSVPGLYKIYIVMISVLPNYRNTRNFRMLLDALCTQLISFAEQSIFFEEVIANAFTYEGISLCETLRMENTCTHEDFGKIYSLKLIPPPPELKFLQCHPRLMELYEGALQS